MGQSIVVPGGGGSGGASTPQSVGTIWVVNSTNASSAYANGLRYIKMIDGATEFVEFQFLSVVTGNVTFVFSYAMSSATANSVRLRFDSLIVTAGGNPTTAVTTGTAFTVTPGSNVLVQEVDSGDSANLTLAVTAGDIVYGYLTRLGTDGADTHTGDFRLIDIRAMAA